MRSERRVSKKVKRDIDGIAAILMWDSRVIRLIPQLDMTSKLNQERTFMLL